MRVILFPACAVAVRPTTPEKINRTAKRDILFIFASKMIIPSYSMGCVDIKKAASGRETVITGQVKLGESVKSQTVRKH
jgi:hypothetical protein